MYTHFLGSFFKSVIILNLVTTVIKLEDGKKTEKKLGDLDLEKCYIIDYLLLVMRTSARIWDGEHLFATGKRLVVYSYSLPIDLLPLKVSEVS